MKNIRIFRLLGLVLLMISCSGRHTDNQKNIDIRSQKHIVNDKTRLSEQKADAMLTFPFPEIPVVLTQSEERKEYLLEHFWDRFDFSDTLLVNDRNISEQGLANQFSLLADKTVSEKWRVKSIENLCSGIERHEHARNVFMRWIEHYLYDPNSPFYNEPLYSIYLQRMLRSSMLDEARRSPLEFQLKLLERNRPGTKAENFPYYLPDGSRTTLDKTSVKGEFLLLFFYDPECPKCHKILEEMTADKELSVLATVGKLTVLAIYTEGDETIWKTALADMPEEWLVGNDRQTVKENTLYDLRAMPTLYLLDKRKTVILKDTSYETVKKNLGIR